MFATARVHKAQGSLTREKDDFKLRVLLDVAISDCSSIRHALGITGFDAAVRHSHVFAWVPHLHRCKMPTGTNHSRVEAGLHGRPVILSD